LSPACAQGILHRDRPRRRSRVARRSRAAHCAGRRGGRGDHRCAPATNWAERAGPGNCAPPGQPAAGVVGQQGGGNGL